MKLLSIIIPCYNERATVTRLLENVAAADLSVLGLDKEILLVDDGSTDGTAEELRRFAQENPQAPLRVLTHRRNRGKGAAIRTALTEARGEVTLIQDADLEYTPNDYPHLLQPILAGVTRVVYGSRWLAPTLPISGPLYTLGGWLENKYLQLLWRTNVTDIATCFKVVTTDLLRELRLEAEGFEFCPEVTAKLLNRRELIVEVPIAYRPRKKHEGKKIRWTDFFVALYTLTKIRLRH